MRLDVRRIAAIKEGDEVTGNRTRVKVVKNKMAPPFRQAEFDILYNRGISIEGDLLDLGVECGIVEKSGAWLSFEGERIGQGRENARKLLLENPDVRGRLTDAVYAAKGIKRPVLARWRSPPQAKRAASRRRAKSTEAEARSGASGVLPRERFRVRKTPRELRKLPPDDWPRAGPAAGARGALGGWRSGCRGRGAR